MQTASKVRSDEEAYQRSNVSPTTRRWAVLLLALTLTLFGRADAQTFSLSHVDPETGVNAGGESIAVVGTFLTPGASAITSIAQANAKYRVYFGPANESRRALFNSSAGPVITNTTMNVIAPPSPSEAPQSVNVTVAELDSTGNIVGTVSGATYTYQAAGGEPLELFAVTPDVGPLVGGQPVTLDGIFLEFGTAPITTAAQAAAAFRVYFGDSQATFDTAASPIVAGSTMHVITPGSATEQAVAITVVSLDSTGSATDTATGVNYTYRNIITGDAPVITLLGGTSVNAECGQDYEDAGATAEDLVDGNVSEQIVVSSDLDTTTPGEYTVIYNVTDNDGNAADPVTRTVTVRDASGPAIEFTSVVTISCGTPLDTSDGVTVQDACEGLIDGDLTVTGDFDVNTPGDYELIYNATDSLGNTAPQAGRLIRVLDDCGTGGEGEGEGEGEPPAPEPFELTDMLPRVGNTTGGQAVKLTGTFLPAILATGMSAAEANEHYRVYFGPQTEAGRAPFDDTFDPVVDGTTMRVLSPPTATDGIHPAPVTIVELDATGDPGRTAGGIFYTYLASNLPVPEPHQIAGAILLHLTDADANSNGLLDFNEARNIFGTLTQGAFALLDENSDGQLSRAELEAGQAPPRRGCGAGRKVDKLLTDIKGRFGELFLLGLVSLILLAWRGTPIKP